MCGGISFCSMFNQQKVSVYTYIQTQCMYAYTHILKLPTNQREKDSPIEKHKIELFSLLFMSYLQFGVMMNSADTNFLSCVSVHMCIQFCRVHTSECGIAESEVNKGRLFSKVVVPISTPIHSVRIPTANTWDYWVLKLCQFDERLMVFIVVQFVFFDC